MKKSIAILLILALATFGLFAAVDNNKDKATIEISSNVSEFSAFGVSTKQVALEDFKSIALFQKAVSSSIDTKVDMLNLYDYLEVGFLSGINNTKGNVDLTITIKDLASGKDSVAMLVSPEKATIAPSKDSKFGILENTVIKVMEAKTGAAALAPAGKYTTTVTIALVTVS